MAWELSNTSSGWELGTINYVESSPSDFSIISPPENLLRGGSYSLTCENVSEAPSASTLDGQPITVDVWDSDSIEFTVPLNTLAGHGTGKVVSFTVAGVTRTFNTSFEPDSGRDVVTLSDPEGGEGTIFEGMTNLDTDDPLLPVPGGQVIWSETTTPNESQVSYPVIIGADGWPEIDVEGSVFDGTETFSFQYLLPGVAISNLVTISLQDYLEPFEFTGSGGITVGGSADLSHAFAATGSGGITVGGSAEYSFPTAEPFEFTGSGGLVFSGSADYSGPVVAPFDFTGSGGLRVGGSAYIDAGGTILPPSGLVVVIDTSDQIIQSADRPLDPYDTEWVVFAWDDRIANATVITSDWVMPTDWNLVRTAQNQEISARGRAFQSVNAALVDVNNAQPGRYVVSNRVHLSDGRQFERSVKIKIREM